MNLSKYHKRVLILSLNLVLTHLVFSQSGFVMRAKNTTAVATDKARTSAVGGFSVSSNARPSMPNDERDKPVSTLEATTDLEGTLFVNEKAYPITEGSVAKIPVPKSYSYYFVTKDTLFTTTEIRQSLKTHELKAPVKLNLLLRQDYEKGQFDKEKTGKTAFILRGIADSMRRIEGGKLPTKGNRAGQVVNTFEIMSHEITVAEFEVFVLESKKIALTDDKDCMVFPINSNSLQSRELRKGVNWSCDPVGRQRLAEHYNHPVVNVSWAEAAEFCAWLSSKDKFYTYRLPTRAEWEFAAGCGENAQIFAWDTELSRDNREGSLVSEFANTADVSLAHQLPNLKKGDMNLFDGYPFTSPVCAFIPNCFQLYDMNGNVGEWVDDFYFSEKPTQKPQKTYKGGSYFTLAKGCEIINNNGLEAQMRHSGIGFRVVRVRK
jgi:formylglycine-generating enzyme required for sulfatase activity